MLRVETLTCRVTASWNCAARSPGYGYVLNSWVGQIHQDTKMEVSNDTKIRKYENEIDILQRLRSRFDMFSFQAVSSLRTK